MPDRHVEEVLRESQCVRNNNVDLEPWPIAPNAVNAVAKELIVLLRCLETAHNAHHRFRRLH